MLLTAASVSGGRTVSLKRTQAGRIAGDRGALTVIIPGEREISQVQADTPFAGAVRGQQCFIPGPCWQQAIGQGAGMAFFVLDVRAAIALCPSERKRAGVAEGGRSKGTAQARQNKKAAKCKRVWAIRRVSGSAVCKAVTLHCFGECKKECKKLCRSKLWDIVPDRSERA